MRIPKITDSIDGNKGMSIKIEFKAGREEMKIALGEIIDADLNLDLFNYNIDHYKEMILTRISKMDIYKKARKLFFDRGDAMWMVNEGWRHESTIEYLIEEYIDTFFPEFKEE